MEISNRNQSWTDTRTPFKFNALLYSSLSLQKDCLGHDFN